MFSSTCTAALVVSSTGVDSSAIAMDDASPDESMIAPSRLVSCVVCSCIAVNPLEKTSRTVHLYCPNENRTKRGNREDIVKICRQKPHQRLITTKHLLSITPINDARKKARRYRRAYRNQKYSLPTRALFVDLELAYQTHELFGLMGEVARSL